MVNIFSRNFKHFRIYLSVIFFCNGCILHLQAQTPLPTRHAYILSCLGLDHKQSLSIEIPSSNVLRASPTVAVYRARAIITAGIERRSRNLVLQQAFYPRLRCKNLVQKIWCVGRFALFFARGIVLLGNQLLGIFIHVHALSLSPISAPLPLPRDFAAAVLICRRSAVDQPPPPAPSAPPR
jgi:hypothetical protein